MKKSPTISLLSTFSTLDLPIKQALADIEKPLLLSFAALAIAEDFAERDYLSAEHIVAALEAAGVAIKRTQVLGALSKAGARVSKRVFAGETFYRLMTIGRRQIEPLLGFGPIQVMYIKSGMPTTARKHLRDILAILPGDTRICDPYYGLRSLESLLDIPANSNIKFLTSHTSEKTSSLFGPLMDFKRERPNVEIRKLQSPNTLHDRYILTSDNLFILGQGIKDIGVKESFIINISRFCAPDLLKNLTVRFDKLWVSAMKI
jgi:hypothetical protein